MLLCDFHIHTNYSDGKLTVPEVVDFYGRRGFDCICITDHLGDPRRLIGKLSKLVNLTLGPEQLDEYFDVLERETPPGLAQIRHAGDDRHGVQQGRPDQENLRPFAGD